MAPLNRILLTGAAGALGRQLRQRASEIATHVRLTDRDAITDLAPHEEFVAADLTSLSDMIEAVSDVDVILHFGARGLEGPFDVILQSNIVGSYNVYEAARKKGVKRVVFASSIHAIGFYERTETIDAKAPTRPDSLYGVSKTFTENLSRYYYDKFGIESVCLRIGSCYPEPTDRRHLITWISFRDLFQIVRLAATAPHVGHMISFPTSRNRETFWDDRAASSLGFRPEDSADDYREKIMASTPQPDPKDPVFRYQGGIFVANGHYEDDH
jgi:uronate dehydrogenase